LKLAKKSVGVIVDKILINAADPEECRIAMLDSRGTLQEFYTDSNLREICLTNIYKGFIQNIEPSLQAVFVNFGSDRNGFLQLEDIHPEYYLEDSGTGKNPEIKKLLRRYQPVLVQVTKEPGPVKGAALTTYVSLPGRFVVLTPGRKHVGVSRKISQLRERNRLKAIAEKLPVPEGCGYIVRTVAEEHTRDELAEDLYDVYNRWEEIRHEALDAPAPSLIYKEHDLVIKVLRDHFTTECSEILVDEPGVLNKVKDYIKAIAPDQLHKVRLHNEKRPIFTRHQLEYQLETIRQPQVKLKSGGSIVIAPTEALVAIDVNSGKGSRENTLEETVFNTNMEAAEEIARQLRLRDLGGVVVVDFIDMREERHRRDVERKLKESTRSDKAKMDFGSISKFGLLEFTRQKIRPPVESGMFVECPHCGGKGQVLTSESAAVSFLRVAAQQLSVKSGIGTLIFRARLNPDVANYVLNVKRLDLARLEERHNTRILVTGDPSLAPAKFEISQEKTAPTLETNGNILKPGQILKNQDEDGAGPDRNNIREGYRDSGSFNDDRRDNRRRPVSRRSANRRHPGPNKAATTDKNRLGSGRFQ
jgi:ribonuclease E